MNFVLWLATGSLLAWIGYTWLGLNKGRSVLISIAMGAAAGLLGGMFVASLIAGSAADSGEFSFPALFFAAATATACPGLDSLGYRSWGK